MGAVIVGIGAVLAALFLLTKKAEGAAGEVYVDYSYTDPGTPANLEGMIDYAAQKYNVDRSLVKAVAMTESSLNPNAENPADPSYGLMQVMPILAEDFGIVKDWHNPTPAEIAMIKDPQTNLRIGAWFLGRLLKKYSLEISIEMYNVGEAGWKQGRRNSKYVAKVMRYYNEFRANSVG